MPFNGFSKETLDFLVENRIQNSRSWFGEHRGQYEQFVLDPLRELVVALTPTMLDIDPEFTVVPRVNKTIARIYRDTRYSRDKMLYRDVMWITFMRKKKFWEGLPGYYFVFGPDGMEWGAGYYEAPRDLMEIYRGMIIRRDKHFLAAFKAFENSGHFSLCKDKYKRSKYPDEDEKTRAWLDVKNIDYATGSKDFSLLYSPRLLDVLSDDFRLLKPMYDFICAAEAVRAAEKSASIRSADNSEW